MKTQELSMRVEPDVKERAQFILKMNGFTLSGAINICLEKFASGDLSVLQKSAESSSQSCVSLYPPDYFKLFGSVRDDSLQPVGQMFAENDLEEL